MSFHLVRGLTPEQILDFFQRREDGSDIPEIPSTAKCSMEPGSKVRETSTLQCATFTQSKNNDNYGDAFYLAVFTPPVKGDDIGTPTFYSVAVELRHDGCQELYQRCSELNIELRQRLIQRA